MTAPIVQVVQEGAVRVVEVLAPGAENIEIIVPGTQVVEVLVPGPPGVSGIHVGSSPPADTSILWLDTQSIV